MKDLVKFSSPEKNKKGFTDLVDERWDGEPVKDDTSDENSVFDHWFDIFITWKSDILNFNKKLNQLQRFAFILRFFLFKFINQRSVNFDSFQKNFDKIAQGILKQVNIER